MNINKIKNRITDYLGFEVDELLNQGDFVTIFGGAVRDSIADLEIHDVDVLCLSESMRSCDEFLHSKGYILDLNAYKNGFSELYKEIRVVHEPHSFIKIIEGKIHKVQLIKPHIKKFTAYRSDDNTRMPQQEQNSKIFTALQIRYEELLKNVDMTCCGVSINSNGFTEQYNGAVIHCLCQVYQVVEDALMKTDRITDRTTKLNGRGWCDLNAFTVPQNTRDKLETLLKQKSLNKKIKKIKN